jgi:Fic family protein
MPAHLIPALQDLDRDLIESFQQQLRVRWTHSSTALEGNTLDEGETLGVLQYGLTIAGKPLAHHNEVLGHSRALDLIYQWTTDRRPLSLKMLGDLHTAVQTAVEVDHLKPVGAWKSELNSTLARIGGNTVVNDTYARPADVPHLMQEWIREFQVRRTSPECTALESFIWSHSTFARIHPYADGNGRMARLLANIPVIEKGFLPVLIPVEKRLEYIESLAVWQMASGRPGLDNTLDGNAPALAAFQALCAEVFNQSQSLLSEALEIQRKRNDEAFS